MDLEMNYKIFSMIKISLLYRSEWREVKIGFNNK